ncbi:MAG: TonB-dependent receptor [Rhodocyclales bacterium]|nr:TonB-dependent receptor [Rhodocyclales bacterium]
MKQQPVVLTLLAALGVSAAQAADGEAQSLPEMTVRQARPTVAVDNPSPQAQVTAEQMREINVINVEDALKYAPSLFIRKRYIGDRNGIIATRSSGSTQSARSLVYADGLLLSNLLGNTFSFPPRWNVVGAEEIESMEVLYGPFSALLPGNSAGATILMTTRRPERFEAHARVQAFTQDFKVYGTDDTFSGHQEQAMIGGRVGKLSWSLLANNLDTFSQPMSFATSALSLAAGGTPVSGGIRYSDPTNVPRMMFGATSLDHTVQNTAKLRLAYDFTPDTRAAFTYALWRNDSYSDTQTYLRDAAGRPVWSGNVNIGGFRYNLAATAFAPSDSNTENRLLGLTLDSRLSPDWRLELAASDYGTPTDISRTPTTAACGGLCQPGSLGGAGRITFADGTGWRNVDLKAVWKPSQGKAGHAVSFGYHRDEYRIASAQYNATQWFSDSSITTRRNSFSGKTATDALFVQDAWKFDPRWTATLGWRHERWRAFDGERFDTAAPLLGATWLYPSRSGRFNSPKASLSFQASQDWLLRASLGRAWRMPTVSELFQTETRGGVTFISDPSLKPEKVLAKDLTAERALANGLLRLSLFEEQVGDALYSQTDLSVVPNVTRIQNIGRIRVRGAEAVVEASNVFIHGLDFSGSLTYAGSRILSNPGMPASEGKWVPRIPNWRASAFVVYRFDEHWTGSLGARYSGLQYGNLDNSDTNHGDTGSVGKYAVLDARLGYRFNKLMRASLGVDNLNNAKYFIGPHPFPQRTLHAELRIDY